MPKKDNIFLNKRKSGKRLYQQNAFVETGARSLIVGQSDKENGRPPQARPPSGNMGRFKKAIPQRKNSLSAAGRNSTFDAPR